MTLPLSVCMIVRNEADNVLASLTSLGSVASEVIVVDTGSTDATAQLARKAGAIVMESQWQDSFSLARNASLAQATQPFILVLDADERLTPEGLEPLAHYCASDAPPPGRILLRSNTATMAKTRVFPNHSGYAFAGRVHEQVVRYGEPVAPIGTGIVLDHVGYTPEAIASFDKVERNLRLLELDLADSPDDAYLHYQKGRTLFVSGKLSEAITSLTRSWELLNSPVPDWASTLLLTQLYACLRLKQFAQFGQIFELAVDLYPDFTDLYFAYGLALLEGERPAIDDVQAAFEACLALGEPDPVRYDTVAGVGSFKAHYNLALLFQLAGQHELANQHFRAAGNLPMIMSGGVIAADVS
jgi:glycosyltransferase involved in cell wall biosynthesis